MGFFVVFFNWVVLAVADKDGRYSYGGREIDLKKGNVLLLGVGGEGLRVFESAADLYRGREKQVSPNGNSAETQGFSENNRNLQGVQESDTQKSVITDENQTVTQEKKVVLNTEQAEHLLSLMEQNAEAIPTLKLTPDNWVAEFGESGVVQTPIGDVKMGDGQFLKMSAKERKGQFGMVKPTLTNPDIVIKEYSPAMGVERDAKLLFVKTFTDENGNKHIHFESVTVQKDNREVVVSNHRLRENQLLNKMKSGQIVYKSTALDTSEQVSADNQTNTDIGATSQGKGRINSAHTQEEFYSTLPKNDKGEIDEAQMTAEQRIRYAEYELGDDRSELLGYMQDQIAALESQISTLNEKEGKSISERKMLAQMKADRALFDDYMREQTEPTPIGYGAFGAIYDQFKGKAKEAIAFLKSKKSGDALGALHHKDIGDIDLVWGNEGTGKSDGFGLAKLVKYHPEVVDDLQEVLNDMRITSRSDNRINLESGSHQASVRLDWDSERKTWLLTAFEKKNSVSTNTTDTVGTLEESKVNDTATHQNTVSDDKGTTNNSDDQINNTSEAIRDITDKIGAAVAEVEPNPTEAQKRAGNYKKGHVNIQGFDITIENPKGSVRRGTDAKGRAWENTMQNHYGYFKRTEGKDGDHIDVFVGDYPSSEKIFVIDQNNPETKEFDESKVMLGFNSVDEAKKAYMSNYGDNWQGFGTITETTVDEFKRWLYDGAKQRKAFGEYREVIDKQTERRRSIAQEVQRATGIDINLVENADELPASEVAVKRAINKGQHVKAWYNPKTNRAYLYVPNITDRADVERSILHEVVAHKGLRDLLGQERFDGLCDKVYDSIGRKDKVKYGSYVLYGRDNASLSLQDLSKIFGDTDTRRAIADEYMAHLAEGGVDNPTVWDKIVDWVRELLRDMGFGVRISERDIRYMLGRSKENLQRQSKEAGENNKNNATENRFRFTENKKNSNFVKNRQDDSSTRETVLGNGQTVGNRSVREALGKHEKGSEIYRTIQTSYTGGSVGTILSVEEREELEARGINPDWDRRQFLSKLKDEAQKNNVWLDNTYLNDKTLLHDQKARQTSENDVYLNADGKTLTKLNNLSYVTSAEHERNLFAFIDRIDAHNNLFPNVAYNIVGFMDNKNGNTAMVLEQPYISSERNATQDEINDYLTSIGFQLDGKRGWSNEHPVWTNGKYELFDARPANVLKDEDGSLYFIDVVPHSVEYMDNDSDMRFRLTDEEQAIKGEAIASGAFMKAPNGKATNLNEKQWLQVRTDAFKKWFGDWEKAARIEKLKGSKPIVNQYNGEYELKRENAKAWAKKNIRGTYSNKDTGDKIDVSRVGVDKVTSHGERDEAHLKSIVSIPQIIENSIFIDELPNEKDNDKYDSYRYYISGLKIDGEDYTVKMVVGIKGDNKYYDHELTEIEKGQLIDSLNLIAKQVAKNQSPLSEYKDRKLISLLQTNSSKVVDENGEPMVVYHGTPKFGFTVFDKEFSDDKTGIFFANKADIAKGYAGVSADVKSLSQDNSNNDLSKDEILSVMFEDVDTSLTDGYDAAGILSYVAPDIAISVEYGEDDGFTAPEDIGVLTLNSSYSGDTYRLTPDEYSWDKVLDWLRYNADLDAVVDSEAGIYGVFINAPNILNIDAGGAVWSLIPKNRVPGAGDTGFMDTRNITKLAKEQGYDGVYIKELQDVGGRGYGLVGDVQGDIFISLVDGSQIKSATDNVGTFDEANGDIRFRVDEHIRFRTVDEEQVKAYKRFTAYLSAQICRRIKASEPKVR